jgi:hypothetical protein
MEASIVFSSPMSNRDICYTISSIVSNFSLTVSYNFYAYVSLKEGRYEYKYVVDGNWLCNEHEMKTKPNADGHVNNYIQVRHFPESTNILHIPLFQHSLHPPSLQVSRDDTSIEEQEMRERLTGPNPDLTKEERLMIKEYLEQYSEG